MTSTRSTRFGAATLALIESMRETDEPTPDERVVLDAVAQHVADVDCLGSLYDSLCGTVPGAWSPAPEIASNGNCTILRVPLGAGCRALVLMSDQSAVEYAGLSEAGSLWEDVRDAAPDDLHAYRPSEWLASFDLDGLAAEVEADESWDGPCAVWCKPEYPPGTYDAPQAGLVRDDDGHVCVFASREDARAYVDEYYGAPSGYDGIRACNVLSHDQYSADALTIVEWTD